MNTPVRLRFAVPYFLNKSYKTPHRGSIHISANVDIFIRSVVEQLPSLKTVFCFLVLPCVATHKPDAASSRLNVFSHIRLIRHITEIDITDLHFSKISAAILVFRSLQTLVINNGRLTAIPDFIGNLSSLTTLSLPNNNLTSVSPTIPNLNHLKQLTVDNNPHLHSLEEINGHPSLTTLIARNCSIERLPRNLPQLTGLYLSGNRLTDLDGIQALGSSSSKEKFFFVNRNEIQSVLDEISSMKNLTNNLLFELPA